MASERTVLLNEGDRSALNGTQWAEWISDGCRARGGMSWRIMRYTKGQRTMILIYLVDVNGD